MLNSVQTIEKEYIFCLSCSIIFFIEKMTKKNIENRIEKSGVKTRKNMPRHK